MLFVNAIETYLDWKRTHTSFAADRYAVRLLPLSKFLGSDKLLYDVSGDDIIRFHRTLAGVGFQEGETVKQYSLTTIAYSANVLKNFFSFWHGRRETNVNPKEILAIRHTTPIKRIVTFPEFELISASLKDCFFDELRKKLMVHLLWDTGMRISELYDMNIADIGPMHPIHQVRSARIRTRKTMKYDLVAWSKTTDDLLNKFLGLRLCINTSTNALFITKRRTDAKRVTIRTFQRWVREIVAEVKLGEGITAHSFRHGKGHHILNTSGNIRDISVILRHVKPESSFHYLHLNGEQFLQTASKYLSTT